MPTLLKDGRVTCEAGQRMRMRILVTQARLVIDTMGGLPALQHMIADSGFRDVVVTDAPPASWFPRAVVTPVTFPDWLLWVEAIPSESTEIRADFQAGALITDAWTAAEPTAPNKLPGTPVNPTLVPAAPGSLSPGAVLAMGFGFFGLVVGLVAWKLHQEGEGFDDA